MRPPPVSARLVPALLGLMLSAAVAADQHAPDRDASRALHAGQRDALSRQRLEPADANRDGHVDRAEYAAWIDRRFDRLGGGRDVVTAADFAPSGDTGGRAARRSRQRAERFLQHYGGTGASEVTRRQYRERELVRFERLAGEDGRIRLEPRSGGRARTVPDRDTD